MNWYITIGLLLLLVSIVIFGIGTYLRWYGVIVVDGVQYSRDSAGIQNAVNDCKTSGCRSVYLPAGVYEMTDAIAIPPGVTVSGRSASKTIFRAKGE